MVRGRVLALERGQQGREERDQDQQRDDDRRDKGGALPRSRRQNERAPEAPGTGVSVPGA